MATAMWAGFTLTPRGLCSVFFAVFVESGSVSPCGRGVSFVVVRPLMLRIKAGMNQTDSDAGLVLLVVLSALCFLLLSSDPDVRHLGRYGPEGQVCSTRVCPRPSNAAVAYLAGFAGDDICTASRYCRQDRDAWHLGRYGPEGPFRVFLLFTRPLVCNDRCHGLWGAGNCGISTVAVHLQGLQHPCHGAQCRFPWSCSVNHRVLQWQYPDKVIDVGCAGTAYSLGYFVANGQPSSHSCSSLNSGPVVACPLCATTDAVVDVLTQFIDVGGRRCGAAATSSICRP